MATMFPHIALDTLAEFTTPGEERLYRFLQKSLRPDGDFIVWYSPDVQGLEPDFVIYSPDSGIVAVEVKDWRLEQIVEVNPKEVCYIAGVQERQVKNPQLQARDYVNAIMRKLGKSASLCSAMKAGKPGLPVIGCVVMMNITRQAFCDAGLDKVLDTERMLFGDEVHPQSAYSQDLSGQTLRKDLQKRFPPLFPFQLSQAQMQHLRAALFPIVRIEVPRRGMTLATAQEHINILDHIQENLARQFTRGKRLIRGASGSGKTLVLTHQAAHLQHSQNKIKRILITCYNLTLANYMRRLLASKHITYGEDAVEVVPFFELCRRILGENIPHSGEEKDFYAMVIEEVKNTLITEQEWQERYDAILVDEGQDFSLAMIDALLPLLNKEHGILSVALDEQQALYTEQSAWEKRIPDLQEHILQKQYRNSVQISKFVAKELGLSSDACYFQGPQGSEPRKQSFNNIDTLCSYITKSIQEMLHDGYPMAEIAVLYASRTWETSKGKIDIPIVLRDALERQGIMVSWVTEDDRAKRRYDITTDSVTLSTIHSVKGMDYAYVFFIGLPVMTASNAEYAKKLAYVGMTRARVELDVIILESE